MKNLPTPEEISIRAYDLWHASGCQHGNHEQDWHDAEAQLMKEYQNHQYQNHQFDDDDGPIHHPEKPVSVPAAVPAAPVQHPVPVHEAPKPVVVPKKA